MATTSQATEKTTRRQIRTHIDQVVEAARAFKARENRSATAVELVQELNGLFESDNDLGQWLASGLQRAADDRTSRLANTPEEARAQALLEMLKGNSPASIFQTTSGIVKVSADEHARIAAKTLADI